MNLAGRPTRFPFWLKILLKFSERPIAKASGKKAKNEEIVGHEVFRQEIMVISVMTNAEKNVNHDEYAKIFAQTAELFIFSLGQRRSLKVEEASYKYSHDFFFGDKMIVKLFIREIENDCIIFEADFCDEAGEIHTHGRQKIYLAKIAG